LNDTYTLPPVNQFYVLLNYVEKLNGLFHNSYDQLWLFKTVHGQIQWLWLSHEQSTERGGDWSCADISSYVISTEPAVTADVKYF